MHRVCVRVASILVFVIGVMSAPVASAWWNDDWAFRKELSLDLSATGANIPANATDVPVLVRLSIANFPYFNDAQPDGRDLRFIAADDKTPLKFHIEKFDAQSQIALLWVRLPRITGGLNGDKFYLYYGNPKGTAAVDAAGTYDPGQSVVYHFAEAAPAAQDSAGYRIEPQSSSATFQPASLIGSGVRFDGANLIAVAAAPALQIVPAKGYTMSAWVKPEGAQKQATVVAVQEGAKQLVLGIDGERAYALWRDGGRELRVAQPGGTVAGEWHHLALLAADGHLALLVDGAEVARADLALQAMNGSLSVGANAAGGNFYRGELDELQVAQAGRSDSWLRAAALSQGMVAPLLIYGGDSQKDAGEHQSYFASTLRNVTVDGWVIIGVLAVMFTASVLIMIWKIVYLNRVSAGNARFLAEFHLLNKDPSDLESAAPAAADRKFGISTLQTLYLHGMGETRKRIHAPALSADRARTLSAQSMEAIRATMDATQTRQTQRLQSQMVWLTIAISGGPFLGLLGTVVGVMITFAAIAASGEVNVNAIAPGTAAALVATVAGLGVAIPCLFGYNYLNTRIKGISADMRVFVDEFVTRIAETYS